MTKIFWFTHTNIVCEEASQLHFDLTKHIETFIEKELWKKSKYRTEYANTFERDDIEKIKSLKLHIHSPVAPYSNLHQYEELLREYIDLSRISRERTFLSGIPEAKKIAVIEVEMEMNAKLMSNLSYEQEKDIDTVMAQLDNLDAWHELQVAKSVICEFVQFFMFNLHLNFLSDQYTFSIVKKSDPIGFTLANDSVNLFYEADRMDLLAHYVLYVAKADQLKELMDTTALFWCDDIPPIHFFLDSLKGNYITSTNFIKLVFTLESFFEKNISNDYITLVIPLLTFDNGDDMKKCRAIIRKSFQVRNDIVHGNKLIDFLDNSFEMKISPTQMNMKIDELFYELKNIITKLFYFFIREDRYLDKPTFKITHDKIFSLLPKGI